MQSEATAVDADAGLDATTHFLVREYLARKGLRETLKALDAEKPVSNSSVNNRNDVVKAFKLDEALRKNRTRRPRPLSTLLELLIEPKLAKAAASDDDDDDDDESDDDEVAVGGGGGDSSSSSDDDAPRRAAPSARPPVAVSLPSGGPLGGPSRARPASARPTSARPASARPGSARTPHSGPLFEVKCTELPSNSVAFQNRNPPQQQQPAGGATNGSQPVVPLAAKPVGFIGRRDEKLVVTPGMLNGGPVELLELENCEVLILDWSNQVVMESCRKCKVLAGPCDGSLMMRSCEEVTLHAVCRQLRCRECTDCTLRLFTLGPIIESSSRIKFHPWDAAYPRLTSHFAAAKLDPTTANKWAEVHDFNDPEKRLSPPNWEASSSSGAAAWVVAVVPGDDEGAKYGKSENPVPRAAAAVDVTEASSTGAQAEAPGVEEAAVELQ